MIFALLACLLVIANASEKTHKDNNAQIERFMALIHGRPKDARPKAKGLKEFVISEADLNAHIAKEIESREKKQIQSAAVQMPEKNKLVVICVAKIDLSKALGNVFKSNMGLEQKVRVEATWVSAKGKGFLKIESLALNGFTLPASLTDNLIRHLAAKQKPPIDPAKFFPLPYGIDKITILPREIRIKA